MNLLVTLILYMASLTSIMFLSNILGQDANHLIVEVALFVGIDALVIASEKR